jgi:SAM-dependent methyltransferase
MAGVSSRRPPDPRDVAAAYDRGAAGFDDRFEADPRTARRFARIEAPIVRACAGARRILEIGCGTGRLLSSIPAPRRVGVDVSRGLLSVCARRFPHLLLAEADAHRLPFADETFDAVVAGNAVFRDLDYPRALAECRRVLRHTGRLALHQYAARTRSFSLRPRRPYNPLHLHSPGEIVAPAAAAGLIVDEIVLFRGLPAWPYAVALPRVTAPLALWDHAVLVFHRS